MSNVIGCHWITTGIEHEELSPTYGYIIAMVVDATLSCGRSMVHRSSLLMPCHLYENACEIQEARPRSILACHSNARKLKHSWTFRMFSGSLLEMSSAPCPKDDIKLRRPKANEMNKGYDLPAMRCQQSSCTRNGGSVFFWSYGHKLSTEFSHRKNIPSACKRAVIHAFFFFSL